MITTIPTTKTTAHNWPSISTSTILSAHQLEKTATVLSSRISCLTGGPGTGKTYTAAAIVKAILSERGHGQTAIAAPTGKAAVRCTSTMIGYGLKIEATTIHRLLGVSRNGYDGKGWGFNHNRSNPLPYKFYILDEASMLDTDTFACFMDALPHDAHLLLIGDLGQLPPVGHGAPLRDIIAAGVPVGELTEIRRNSGDIVRVCRDVREGQSFSPSTAVDIANGKNLLHIEAPTVAVTLSHLKRRLLSAQAMGVDPVWDIQVVVAVNQKSDLSRENINKGMQRLLNPNGQEIKGTPKKFRMNDKVICTSNCILPLIEGGYKVQVSPGEFSGGSGGSDDAEEKYVGDFVANGEIGEIVAWDEEEKEFHVSFDLPERVVAVPVKSLDFELAYAVTVHKCQGSSARIVIVIADSYKGADFICSREWHYTAWSRAEELCITIGRIATIHKQCREVKLDQRKTFLRERILNNV